MMLSDVEWDVLQAKAAQGCNLLWTGDLQNPQEWVTASRAHEHAGLAHAWHAGLGYARLMFIFVYLLRKMMPRRLRQVGSCLRMLCGGISALKFGSRPRILRSHPRILRYCLLGTQGGYSCGAGAD